MAFSPRRAAECAASGNFPRLGHALFSGKTRLMEIIHETKDGYTVRCIYPPPNDVQHDIATPNFRRYIQIASKIQRELDAKSGVFDTVLNLTTMKERSNANLRS